MGFQSSEESYHSPNSIMAKSKNIWFCCTLLGEKVLGKLSKNYKGYDDQILGSGVIMQQSF